MNFSIVNIQEVSKQDWDSFAYAHPSSFLWHTYDFIMGKNKWSSHSHESFAVIDEDEKIVGIFPLYKISFKKYRFFQRSYLDNIGGWLCQRDDPVYTSILLKEYRRRLSKEKQKVACINFATSSLCYTEDPLFLQGISSHTARISILDLSLGTNVIWSNIRKGHKSDIKKAQRCGVTFKRASSKDLDVYYEMHKHVCKKSSILPHNKQYFEYIFNSAIPNNQAFVEMAYHEGYPVSAVNYGIYKDKAVYWTGVSYESAYKLGANHFLHWKMIQELHSRGIAYLDMGEVFFKHSSPKIQGIVNFKQGFGGVLRPCFKSIVEKK
ncbi:lipid II:glycine glycyltransferase FemX [Holospora undulata]|uniref:FemAB-related protein, PEP-CTERM system-associated n=1 Tax=Holospora undulata HU1 TaxID=1321371 RepID=A0A061JFN7_9PROT|nr:peptidoglycan bridge formation glycyltransferase FemA/FemB family protein [Holospora undulata]ETZ04416.1 femAB-related protein, PEP-CTERM system-associated [Holospora undulata HU1]ETZ04466.1 femAB-related protein, PEP-CTERM system-associated [Holospora undulata HU1]ETZ04491.1 femAB-related protein, PEP-CTERM system-associated [Holospora undulata HU1]